MASPFSIFRKRQKLFLAIAGVGAMGAFIFLPIMGRMMEGDGGGSSIVVSTKYGELGEREISSLVQQRQISNTFFQRLLQLTLDAMVRGGQISGENFNRFAQIKQRELLNEGLLLPPSERSVVRGMITAKRAEELGLRVSDARINRLIVRVTQDVVTSEEVEGILRSMTARISQQQLFDLIRPELLANDLLYLVNSGMQTNTTPAERWNFFLRTRRQTTAELVEVSVDDFLDQVSDPSEQELLAYFNTYKEEYPRPGSPEPGFRQPERRAFEYFRADFEHFYDEEAITDEEVAAYYEANKENYPYQGLAPDPIETETPDSDDAEAETPSEEPAGEEPPSEDGTPEAEEMPEEESADESDSSESEEEPTEEEPSTEEPSSSGDDPPASEEPETSEEPTAEEDQASVSLPTESLQTLFSSAVAGALFLQEEGSDNETDSEPTETESTENPNGGSDETLESESDAAESDADDSADDASEEAAATESEPFISSLSLRDLSVDYLLPRVISQGPNPKYDPLWRVEESIRTTMAREKASGKMEAVLGPLRQKMQAYSRRRLDWEIARDENRDIAEPARLDFESMVADLEGITAKTTEIVSAQQLVDEGDLGNASVFNTTGQATGSIIAQAYSNTPDFSAVMARDSDGNEFLYWIVEKREANIPTLEKVHDEVLLSWKRKEARQLARDHAETLADVARDPKFNSLVQAFAEMTEIKVIDTGTFTWLTSGDVPMTFGGGQLRLSEIPGVTGMGNDFMRTVFSLAPQSVGVASNEPQTAMYVVRVGEFSPDEFVLRQQFLAAPFSLYQNAGQIDRRETQLRWFDQLLADADIKWVREPRDDR